MEEDRKRWGASKDPRRITDGFGFPANVLPTIKGPVKKNNSLGQNSVSARVWCWKQRKCTAWTNSRLPGIPQTRPCAWRDDLDQVHGLDQRKIATATIRLALEITERQRRVSGPLLAEGVEEKGPRVPCSLALITDGERNTSTAGWAFGTHTTFAVAAVEVGPVRGGVKELTFGGHDSANITNSSPGYIGDHELRLFLGEETARLDFCLQTTMPPVCVEPLAAPMFPTNSQYIGNVLATPTDGEPNVYPYVYDAKRRNHAEAQVRYRERNLADTRAKVRVRMKRLRAARNLSEEGKKKSADGRRDTDADYRERRRKQSLTCNRKFIQKFSEEAFITQYLLLHNVYGKYLAGQRFVGSDEGGKPKRRKSNG
ncbi:hypothetical protein K438DRAFT_1758829 [Mycena galopus ATCC 62051]|nr:hypothetical protein K438DRAFT_1758829 [Mycena galopus ATCC 62051]